MTFTLYSADSINTPGNCIYPNKIIVTDTASLESAVSHDYVCAEYRNSYRNNDNFLGADCLPVDCDNDHSENPSDWVTPDDIKKAFPKVSFAVHFSRYNMREKNGKPARPKFHVLFPIERITDADVYSEMKKLVNAIFPYFDTKALDSARFFFGTQSPKVELYQGEITLSEYLYSDDFDEDMYGGSYGDNKVIPQGNRNSAMSHFAGRVIKKYGNTEKAFKCFMEEADKCTPPLEENELKTIWHSAQKFYKKVQKQDGYIPPEQYNKPPEWETPIPFDEYELPVFPVDALPKTIGDYVTALAESTQTPVDMAASSALAVISVCMQGKYKIKAKADWTEPVNLFVLDVMNPSERKSAVENAMIKPINLFESERNSQNAPAIESSKMQKRILERRQKALEDQAAKGKADAEEVRKIAEEIANYKDIKPMKLYVDDITTEKLTSVLAGNNGCAAILSTEGGIFDTLAGTYSKSVNIDVMLKGYSGDSIRVDRIGRNSESIMNPALTVLLMVQPSVLSGLMQNGTFRGRGLTARFLYCIPKSFVGMRKYRSKPVPDDVYRAYERCIINLLEDELENETEIITLSKEADEMIENFAEQLEPKLKKEYADIADWCGKLVGNILRISALLTRSSVYRSHEFLEIPEPLTVDAEMMKKAIKIGEYFTEHAKAAFMMMGADPVIHQSKRVVETIRENGIKEFTRRDIMRICRNFKKADDVQSVLNRLADYGYIAEKPQEGYSGKGRPPAQVYITNPYVFEKDNI